MIHIYSQFKVPFFNTATEKSRTNWHLVNVRQQSTQQYVMKYIKKGSRVFVGGRIEYLRSQDEQGQTKDLAVIISGKLCFTYYTTSTNSIVKL